MNIGTYKIENYQILTPSGDIINKRKVIYYRPDGEEELVEFFDGDMEDIRPGYTPQP
jgi:hypothetical protein